MLRGCLPERGGRRDGSPAFLRSERLLFVPSASAERDRVATASVHELLNSTSRFEEFNNICRFCLH